MSRPARRAALALVACLAAALSWLPAGAAAPTITSGSVTSFDGTKITYHLFIPAGASASSKVPIVLMTHGWGGSGATANTGQVALLTAASYAVLTWDQRGFGTSGGEANVDAQEFEVRDVEALITFAASRPQIQTDAPGDPRMGMLGGSYAGGIQLMTAAADNRVDAIAPDIAWNDLPYALFPNGVIKFGWDTALYALGAVTATADGLPAGETGSLALEIHKSFVEGAALNSVSPQTLAWFDARSPKHYINGATLPGIGVLPGIHAPTLLTQGTIDTLFNLNHAIANAAQIAANGVPTKMIYFCGGHAVNLGTCTAGDEGAHIDAAVLAWFDRYIRGNASSDTGAAIEYQTQDGAFHSIGSLPATVATGSGTGKVVNTIVATSGTPVSATPAPDGLRFTVAVPAGAHLIGIPKATLSVTGIGPEASLFFKLVDVPASGQPGVIDDQATPIKIAGLSGKAKTFTINLAGVAWAMQAGHSLAIEVSSTSLNFSSTRTPFVANVRLSVTVPYLIP